MKKLFQTSLSYVKKQWVLLPYAWLFCFFAIPFVYLFKISLSETVLAIPPVSSLLEFPELGKININLDFSHYLTAFSDTFYVSGFVTSLIMASLTTIICLILGYGMAYGLIQLPSEYRTFGLLLIMIPFSTSFLIRIYAWITLLSQQGIINTWLMNLGIIKEPLSLLYNNGSALLGLVYCYLPFMILPIYATLDKMESSYLEAAADLGATPFRRFYQITLPLSMPGILAGCVLVFVPVTGEFVIPELLGSPDGLMIGRILWTEFFSNRDWPLTASLAIILLILFVFPIVGLQRFQENKREAGES